MKKIIRYFITITLASVLVFAAGSFSSCKKEPEKEPDHETETPTPNPPFETTTKKTFALHNWYVSLESGVPSITLTEDNYATATFPVPEREHYTFNGWYIGEDKVADENGKSLMTKEIFDSAEPQPNKANTKIFAKWTAEETFTYRILLIYVTRVDAVLPAHEVGSGDTFHVDYTMSDLEREFCHATTVNLKNTMDALMDGLVDFQIEEYYTDETVVAEDIQVHNFPFSNATYYQSTLLPNQISEVADILDKYDACISFTNLSTEVRPYNIGGEASGSSYQPYAEISMDSFFHSAVLNGKTLEQQLAAMIEDPDYDDHTGNTSWHHWLDIIMHEHAHILECRITEYYYTEYNFHDTSVSTELWKSCYDDLLCEKYYYLQLITKNGITVGIPYGFWKGEIAKVEYWVTDDRDNGNMGYIRSDRLSEWIYAGSAHSRYQVVYGEKITVTAIPYPGYKFVRWSDGVETAERTDLITGDFEATAIFEPIVYTVEYVATEGGHIEGDTIQSNPIRTQFGMVEAVAEEGYRFVGWSDGETRNQRIDFFQFTDLFDENNKLKIYAIFEKI